MKKKIVDPKKNIHARKLQQVPKDVEYYTGASAMKSHRQETDYLGQITGN